MTPEGKSRYSPGSPAARHAADAERRLKDGTAFAAAASGHLSSTAPAPAPAPAADSGAIDDNAIAMNTTFKLHWPPVHLSDIPEQDLETMEQCQTQRIRTVHQIRDIQVL